MLALGAPAGVDEVTAGSGHAHRVGDLRSHYLPFLSPQKEEPRQHGVAGAGAGCLPPRAPLCHSGLPVPLLLVCCEDPGWSQTHQPPGRFQARLLAAQALGAVCGRDRVCGTHRGKRAVLGNAGHVLPCGQPRSQGLLFSSSHFLSTPHQHGLTQVGDRDSGFQGA